MSLADWRALDWAPPNALRGRWTRLERLAGHHLDALHAANPSDEAHWRYMSYGPFADRAGYEAWAQGAIASPDPAYYAIGGERGWSGVASLMRIDRAMGVIEIGNIALSPGLQRSRAATEAVHLMIDHAFASGFRRVEWKCNAENAPSLRAAARLGFAYEGTFRQHMVVKGRNRDTAWFAILAGDWPRIGDAHRAWLDASNFDADGRQMRPLRIDAV